MVRARPTKTYDPSVEGLWALLEDSAAQTGMPREDVLLLLLHKALLDGLAAAERERLLTLANWLLGEDPTPAWSTPEEAMLHLSKPGHA